VTENTKGLSYVT